MNIVIVGIGKVGSTVAQYLSSEGHEVVIVDKNPDVVDRMASNFDVLGICGNGASLEVQRDAGVSTADLIISLTSSDEFNILCCILAKKSGARHAIARVRNPDYFHQMMFLRKELGLSMAINPEFEAANAISRMLRFPTATKLELFAKGRLEIAEITLSQSTPLEGVRLCELPEKFKAQVLICAVRRGDDVVIPDGNFVLHAGDHINISASHEDISSFFKQLGVYQESVRSVFIVGGGRIAYYLATQLLQLGIRVKIVEQDEATCEMLSEMLPKATILHGDGTDQDLLMEEGLAATDACVALTGIDEENIIVSMFATMKQVKKVITKVNRSNLFSIMRTVGIESVVSPRAVTGDMILRYVRARRNSQGNSVQTLYKLLDGKLEALEFIVSENASFVGKTLRDLEFKKGILVAGIVRDRKLIHPQGNDVMLPGDLVVIISSVVGLRDLRDTLAEG